MDVVYLGFSKASASVSHSILLETLAAHILNRLAVQDISWMKKQLDSQTQREWSSIQSVTGHFFLAFLSGALQ